MEILYILGGPPRTAKTTIMTDISVEKRLPIIATDAINHGIRNVLTGQPNQMLRHVEFSGQAEHKTSVSAGGEMLPFSGNGIEADFTIKAIVGMLAYYRKNHNSVLFQLYLHRLN